MKTFLQWLFNTEAEVILYEKKVIVQNEISLYVDQTSQYEKFQYIANRLS